MITKLKKFYLNLKIPDKIKYVNISFFIFLFILLAIIGNTVADNITVKKAMSITENNFNDIDKYFEGINNKVSSRLRYLMTSVNLQEMLREKKEFYKKGEAINTYQIGVLLEEIANIKYIDAIHIYDIEGNNIAQYLGDNNILTHQFLYDSTFDEICKSEEDLVWFDDDTNKFLDEKRLKIYKKIVDSNDGSVLGIIEVLLNTNEVMELYNYIGFNKVAQLFVITNSGNIVLPLNDNNKAPIVEQSFNEYKVYNKTHDEIRFYNGVRYFVKEKYLSKYNVYVGGVIYYDDIIKEKNEICNVIYMVGFIFIIFESFFSFILSRSISTPIVMLVDDIEKISKDNLSVRTNFERQDEIGKLSQAFDEMLEKVENLMGELEKSEQMKRKLQLLSLQTQINPHFLYNSLESLGALAQLGYTDDLFKMSKALSLFYRGVLSDGKSRITLREELKIVENYLTIQHIRYVDVFDYEIDVAEELLDIKVVKLSIQPFVENAIYHGIKLSRKDDGKIWIKCYKDGEDAVISIIDNGKGFDTTDMKMNESDMQIDTTENDLKIKRKGFGISNVSKRIQLYFGEKYGVTISSKIGLGTTVKIILPIEAPEGDD